MARTEFRQFTTQKEWRQIVCEIEWKIAELKKELAAEEEYLGYMHDHEYFLDREET